MTKLTVVIATCRQESITRWVREWHQDLWSNRVIVVEDNPVKSFDLGDFASDYEHYAWDDIEAELGDSSWIIPRRTSAIKSFGFWKARDSDYIWTLDDDCYPEEHRKGKYTQLLEDILKSTVTNPVVQTWWNTLDDTVLYPRGYPYGVRETAQVMVHHGLWSGIPDLDGITALKYPLYRTEPAKRVVPVPGGKLFPMCGMNLAFRREMLPAMYFMLQGHMRRPYLDQPVSRKNLQKLPFDRFDDIWAGLFVKKITDHFGWAITSGSPSIFHTKESDPQERVLKEAPGIKAHELFWQIADGMDLSACKNVQDCYITIADAVYYTGNLIPEYAQYWNKLAYAMNTWAHLPWDSEV